MYNLVENDLVVSEKNKFDSYMQIALDQCQEMTLTLNNDLL